LKTLKKNDRDKMKSTARMIGAWKGWDSRRRNQLRMRALGWFTELAKANKYCLPAIIKHPKDDWGYGTRHVELCLNWGDGYVSRWFDTWAEAADYLIDIAPKCGAEI